jgi:hypothetical protein
MKLRAGSALVAVVVLGAAGAAQELRLLGTIKGQVRNSQGFAQMGAHVLLLGHADREVQKVLTGIDGSFLFSSLLPDNYTVRVSHTSFVPAMRQGIAVRPGGESHLTIQLATIFSSIELVYASPGQNSILSEDWKWTLRSSAATRPVLRLMPEFNPLPRTRQPEPSMFTSTRGMVRLSAGDQGASSTLGSSTDLGTAFALASTLFGENHFQVAGNLGLDPRTGSPAIGFATRYSHSSEGFSTPDLEVSVRQVELRHRTGRGLFDGPGSPREIPILRTFSAKVEDRMRLTDELSIDYGSMLEAVAFLDRLNVFSPFARLHYSLGDGGALEAAYSSGAPAFSLLNSGGGMDGTMQRDLAGLALFPRVSLRGGHARVQRSENFELAYRRSFKTRSVSVALFEERLRDLAITTAAPAGLFAASELMPDISSNSSIFNAGRFRSRGYVISYTENLGGWGVALLAGSGGAIAPGATATPVGGSALLRSNLHMVRQPWASARINGTLPGAGTRIVAAYIWTPPGTLGPTHAYLTQQYQPQLGLNFQLRQPLPGGNGLLPGKLEATAEVRNLLAEGYVPIPTADGRSLVLVQFPRSLRGGLSFIF